MIALEGVTKTFDLPGQAVHAVKDVTLTIEEGEVFGIIGFSGAGKSTLVRCINLLERPTSGRVRIDGVDLTALSPKELRQTRKKIGMIFQQFNLFASRTVLQDIAYPLKYSGYNNEQIVLRVRELLALVDLKEKENAYPSQLSGGQKQRVAIARALACSPSILLCDEATSALDPQTTLSILKLLKKLNARLGITIVVVTHEMQVIKEICGRVAVMEGGAVVEQGDVFSIFARPKREITKAFVNTTSNLSKINALIEEHSPVADIRPGECIVKLKYVERSVSEALISAVSRKFDIDANIIFGNIELIGSAPLGGLVAVLSGKAEKMEAALEYLREKGVGVEVILDARHFADDSSERHGEAGRLS